MTVLLALAACHHPATAPQPESGVVATTSTDRIWILGASGPPVHDTVVTFARASGRTVMLHHAHPDNALFAALRFPAAPDSLHPTDSVRLEIRPVTGEYGVTVTSPDSLPSGSTATFFYGVHFQTPPGAEAKYPHPGQLETILSPALLNVDGKVSVLASSRPGVDVLSFTMARPGTYAIVFAR